MINHAQPDKLNSRRTYDKAEVYIYATKKIKKGEEVREGAPVGRVQRAHGLDDTRTSARDRRVPPHTHTHKHTHMRADHPRLPAWRAAPPRPLPRHLRLCAQAGPAFARGAGAGERGQALIVRGVASAGLAGDRGASRLGCSRAGLGRLH